MLDTSDVLPTKVMQAVTDSGSDVRLDEAAKLGVTNLLEILGACTGTLGRRRSGARHVIRAPQKKTPPRLWWHFSSRCSKGMPQWLRTRAMWKSCSNPAATGQLRSLHPDWTARCPPSV
jgi:hypothetical protein